MSHQKYNVNRGKNYTNKLNRNSRVEKYNSRDETFIKGAQCKCEFEGKRMLENRLTEIIQSKKQKQKRKREISRSLETLGNHQMQLY